MSDKNQSKTPDTVSCEVCLKEVPTSESHIEEADDYVRHFCGLSCYTQWHELAEKESETKP